MDKEIYTHISPYEDYILQIPPSHNIIEVSKSKYGVVQYCSEKLTYTPYEISTIDKKIDDIIITMSHKNQIVQCLLSICISETIKN